MTASAAERKRFNAAEDDFHKRAGNVGIFLDTLHSEMAPEEADPFDVAETVISKDFLKYNYRELAKIALEGTESKKIGCDIFLTTATIA